MAKEKIKDVDNAYRDSHSKGIIFTDNNKYEQAKRRKLERRKNMQAASAQGSVIGKMQRELDELKDLVNKLIKKKSNK